MRRKTTCFVFCLSLVLTPTATTLLAATVKGNGAVVAGSATEVVFDHLNDPSFVEFKLKLHDGELFGITILNTLPNRFDYEVEPVAKPTPQVAATSDVRETDLVPHRIARVHDRKYAGYLVHIKPKDGVAINVIRNDQSRTSLGTAELKISVDTLEFDYEMSGAFTATGLRDPVFALEKKTVDGVEQQFIERDHSAEDDQDLGMAAFVHLFHTRVPWIAGTFGLGINDGSRTTYYAGPSIRFGDKAAITAGVAAGSVSHLPAGLSIGDRVADANVLSNLGTRMGRSWFVGFSYTFLNPGNALKKPFAGEGNVTPAPATPATPPTTTPPATQNTNTAPATQPTPPGNPNPPPATPNSQNTAPDPFKQPVKPKGN